jgi:hypothetical protein
MTHDKSSDMKRSVPDGDFDLIWGEYGVKLWFEISGLLRTKPVDVGR